jgi:hypothetical protein
MHFFLFGNVLRCCYVLVVPLFNRSLFELDPEFHRLVLECIKRVAQLRMGDEDALFKKKGKKGKRN